MADPVPWRTSEVREPTDLPSVWVWVSGAMCVRRLESLEANRECLPLSLSTLFFEALELLKSPLIRDLLYEETGTYQLARLADQ